MNLNSIKEELQKTLSEERFNHSVGTMEKARELARIYGESEEEAAFAGLIHDIAKEMTKDEIEQYIKTNKIEMDEIEKENIGLMHAKLRSKYCKKEVWCK